MDAISARQSVIYDALSHTSARTSDGRQAKARALLAWIEKDSDGTPSSREDRLAYSLACDVLEAVA